MCVCSLHRILARPIWSLSWRCLGVWRQAWRCIGRLYSQGGVRVFYRGCLINALNSGPAAALTFVAHDLLKETLGLA